MKTAFILLLFLTIFSSFGQNLKCEDFDNGEFIGTTPQFPGVEWKIYRNSGNQIEFPEKVPQEYIDAGMPIDTVFGKFERINKCDYRFLYDETKMKLEKYLKSMNDSGGFVIKKKNIVGKCYLYTSKYLIENKEINIEGKICKIE